MNTSTELITQVRAYADRRLGLRDLELWLAPRLRALLTAPDSATGRLAGASLLYMAELKDGLRTERSLRVALKQYLAREQATWVATSTVPTETYSANSDATPLVNLLNQLQVWNNAALVGAVSAGVDPA